MPYLEEILPGYSFVISSRIPSFEWLKRAAHDDDVSC